MSKQCSSKAWQSNSFLASPCALPATRERNDKWYCHVHDPVEVAKRKETRERAYKIAGEKRAADRAQKKHDDMFANECIRAIRSIAAGTSNDPINLACQILREYEK